MTYTVYTHTRKKCSSYPHLSPSASSLNLPLPAAHVTSLIITHFRSDIYKLGILLYCSIIAAGWLPTHKTPWHAVLHPRTIIFQHFREEGSQILVDRFAGTTNTCYISSLAPLWSGRMHGSYPRVQYTASTRIKRTKRDREDAGEISTQSSLD